MSASNNDAAMIAPVQIKRVALVGSIHHLILKHTDFLGVIGAIYAAAPLGMEAVKQTVPPFCERVVKKYPTLDFGKTLTKPVAWRGAPHRDSLLGGFTLALQHDQRGRAPDFNKARIVVEWDFNPHKIIDAIIKYAREDERPADFDNAAMTNLLGDVGSSIINDAEALALEWSQMTLDMKGRAATLARLQSKTPWALRRLDSIEELLKEYSVEPTALVSHVEALQKYLQRRQIIR